MGLTFKAAPSQNSWNAGILYASCGEANHSEIVCNPYRGDILCHKEQPVLCFLDIDAPVPDTLADPQYWTGGVLAPTKRVAGTRFSRLSDANAYCSATFGEGWRVASFHDGGGWALKGYGTVPKNASGFWIDIKDQPQATCWTR